MRVRETVPDAVLGARRRDRARRPHARGADRAPAGGQGLPGRARADAALNGFFRIENLRALREVALRQVAEDVEAQAARPRARLAVARGPARGQPPPQAVERAAARAGRAAGVAASASSAARGARRSGSAASSTCSSSARRAAPSAAEREQLEALRRLASVLGAHLLVEEGDDVARGRRARRARARHDLRADGHPARRAAAWRACGAARRPAAPAAARRRPADRRRPHAGGAVTRCRAREARRPRVSPPAARAAPPRRRR